MLKTLFDYLRNDFLDTELRLRPLTPKRDASNSHFSNYDTSLQIGRDKSHPYFASLRPYDFATLNFKLKKLSSLVFYLLSFLIFAKKIKLWH